jgi:hypothetical protein
VHHEVRYIRNFWTRALIVFIMAALGATVVTGAFSNPRAGVVFVEEEMGSTKVPLTEEKMDSKDKPGFLILQLISTTSSATENHGQNSSTRPGYHSLPEIPPELS